jgi:hypothetical protein
MNAKTYGLDLAKRVFQMHWVDAHTGRTSSSGFFRSCAVGSSIVSLTSAKPVPGDARNPRTAHT